MIDLSMAPPHPSIKGVFFWEIKAEVLLMSGADPLAAGNCSHPLPFSEPLSSPPFSEAFKKTILAFPFPHT